MFNDFRSEKWTLLKSTKLCFSVQTALRWRDVWAGNYHASPSAITKDNCVFADTRGIDQGQYSEYLVLAALLSTDQCLSVYDAVKIQLWVLWSRTHSSLRWRAQDNGTNTRTLQITALISLIISSDKRICSQRQVSVETAPVATHRHSVPKYDPRWQKVKYMDKTGWNRSDVEKASNFAVDK